MSNQIIFDFLKELVANNNREWFLAHKSEYEVAWKRFHEIVDALIQEIGKFDPSVKYLTPKDCIYRLYRDLRFSPDKTPYKGHFGAYINADGKKAYHGGYYPPLDHQQCSLARGVWWLPTKEMHALRHAIVDQVDTYRAIVEEPTFKHYCPTIGMEHYKRIPNGFPKDFPYPEYLLCKNYTCCCEQPHQLLLNDNYIANMADIYRSMKPFNDFLKENILINMEEMEGMKDIVKFF
ncbi:MAG: DUF2461 domain-containing protein [Bacteroidales bacterium]|nr:DUF2461 domain-containing protein [Bacteroidales bacterium]